MSVHGPDCGVLMTMQLPWWLVLALRQETLSPMQWCVRGLLLRVSALKRRLQ